MENSEFNKLAEFFRERMYYKDGALWSKKTNAPYGAITKGYYTVSVNIENKVNTFIQARIIWLLENGPLPDGMVVGYKDGNRLNLELDNLVLCKQGRAPKIKRERELPLCRIYKDNERTEKPWALDIKIFDRIYPPQYYNTRQDAINSFEEHCRFYSKEWETEWEESASDAGFTFNADNVTELALQNSNSGFFGK